MQEIWISAAVWQPDPRLNATYHMDGPQWFTAYGRKYCRAGLGDKNALDDYDRTVCPVAAWYGQQLHPRGLDPSAPRARSYSADL
jgi:hypothetical protein